VKSDHLPDTTVHVLHIRVKLLDVSTSLWCRRAVFVSVELFNLVWEIRQIAFYFSICHFGHRKDTQACRYSAKIGDSERYTSISRVWHRHLKDNWDYMQPGNCAVAQYLGEDGELPCETEIGVEQSNASAAQQAHECTSFDPHLFDLSNREWDN
jgi:hypothetical protein